ncbi:MAG TPA: heavy-metal-associated domain-containing protein [Spirochaetales bacterium]|nr:heavy-metal-associated domain-containing protein [Spirochaetales bacterium]MBP7263244.1 heavy-metal-associated domain-containing protein [Spirochaetia bacterium]HPE35585.1 heavy-metal-associated domain-containing protein [Spirochaetales bacterium]
MKSIVRIEGMSCGHCAMRVQRALESLAGVSSATVDVQAGTAEVEGQGLDANLLRGAVIKAGYTPVSVLP